MDQDIRPMAVLRTSSSPITSSTSSTSYTTSNLRVPRRVRLDIVPETIYEKDESESEAESLSKAGTSSPETEHHYQRQHDPQQSRNKVGTLSFFRINKYSFVFIFF